MKRRTDQQMKKEIRQQAQIQKEIIVLYCILLYVICSGT